MIPWLCADSSSVYKRLKCTSRVAGVQMILLLAAVTFAQREIHETIELDSLISHSDQASHLVPSDI